MKNYHRETISKLIDLLKKDHGSIGELIQEVISSGIDCNYQMIKESIPRSTSYAVPTPPKATKAEILLRSMDTTKDEYAFSQPVNNEVLNEILLEKLAVLGAHFAQKERIQLDKNDPFEQEVTLAQDRDPNEVGPWNYVPYSKEDTLKIMQGYGVITQPLSSEADLTDEPPQRILYEAGRRYLLRWSSQPESADELKRIMNLLNIQKGDKVLDLGCGHGRFVYQSCIRGAECIGVDYSSRRIRALNRYFKIDDFPHGKAYFQRANVEDLPFPDNTFDRIICYDLIEHIDEIQKKKVLSETYRVLKNGGYLVIGTDNLNYFKISAPFRQLVRILRFQNPFKVELRGSRPHIGMLSADILVESLKQSGFIVHQILYQRNYKFDRYLGIINKFISEAWSMTNKWLAGHFTIECQK